MAHHTKELARDSWREYFDKLSRDLPTVEATMEIDGRDIGAQVEADNLLLTGISYDDRDDVLVFALDAPGGPREELEHMVTGPQRIVVDADTILPSAIEVEDEDGRQTIVQLHELPELPAV